MAIANRIVEITFENGLDTSRPDSAGGEQNSLIAASDCVISDEFFPAVTRLPNQETLTVAQAVTDGKKITQGWEIYLSDGTIKTFVAWGTKLGTVQDGVIKNGLTDGLKLGMAFMNGIALFCNGTDTPFKVYDLDTTPVAGDIGLTRPTITNAETAPGGGGGTNVIGTVKYWIAQMSGTVEGALSPVFGEIDCGDGSEVDIDLTDGDFGSNTYRIYRTFSNGAEPFYLKEGVGGNIINDDIEDGELQGPPYAHGDQPPDACFDAVAHFERVFMLAGNTVYWSDIDEPESFWTESNGAFLKVYGDDGDIGVALARARDGIYVFKKNHIYKIRGRVPSEFYVEEITVSDPVRSLGLQSREAMVATPSGIFFAWNNKLYNLVDDVVTPLGNPTSDSQYKPKTGSGSSGPRPGTSGL